MITAPVMKELNWKSLTYRKRVIHRTKIERPFLAGKGFNTNLVHFLLPYYVIILLVTCMYAFLRVRFRFPTCTDVQLKRFCVQEISRAKLTVFSTMLIKNVYYITCFFVRKPIFCLSLNFVKIMLEIGLRFS